jgi:hypothetical protein
MTNFDLKVEKMEEERMKKQNEKWNAMLLNSLRTRTEEEVWRAMFEMLVIPVGSANILGAEQTSVEKQAVLA